MSDAQEVDFQQFLDASRPDLEQGLKRGRDQVLATASSKGTLGSGGTIRSCVAAMEDTLSNYLAELIAVIDRWSGPALSVQRAREMAVAHVSAIIDDLATTETAYSVGTRPPPAGAIREMAALVSQAKTRLLARIHEFELGADRDRNPRPTSVTNIVHAGNIVGGVQQAGGDAIQMNSVALSAEAIGTALEHLLAQVSAVAPGVLAEIDPDALTIRSQLTKAKPNSVIVQESGRTIRSVIEGAVGGALGNAMSPGIVQALTAFSAAVGLG